ncbi:hypothetical protein D3C75_1008860 [compost metagenome]
MLITTRSTEIAANTRINLRVFLISDKPATVILSPHQTLRIIHCCVQETCGIDPLPGMAHQELEEGVIQKLQESNASVTINDSHQSRISRLRCKGLKEQEDIDISYNSFKNYVLNPTDYFSQPLSPITQLSCKRYSQTTYKKIRQSPDWRLADYYTYIRKL